MDMNPSGEAASNSSTQIKAIGEEKHKDMKTRVCFPFEEGK
jgi:hypothetical protein